MLCKAWQRFQQEASHWQFISHLFRPSVTRFFIIWFAAAPAVVKIGEKLNTSNFANLHWQLDFPFSWQVLWWASLAYALSYVIYLLSCPIFVRRYPNFTTYSNVGHSPRWLVWEVFYASLVLSKKENEKLKTKLVEKKIALVTEDKPQFEGRPVVKKKGTIWYFTHKGKSMSLSINESFCENKQKDLFWEILGVFANTKTFLRYVIWALVVISGLLVLVTVVENIFYVLNYFVLK